MFLIQILLPLYNENGVLFPQQVYLELQTELTERFGGVTAYMRSPAKGLWKSTVKMERDDVIMYEVQVETVDSSWWADYKKRMATLFQQETINIRSIRIDLL